MAHFSISLTHIFMFFLGSGVLAWTIVLIVGIHAALTWMEPLFVRVTSSRRTVPTIYRHNG